MPLSSMGLWAWGALPIAAIITWVTVTHTGPSEEEIRTELEANHLEWALVRTLTGKGL